VWSTVEAEQVHRLPPQKRIVRADAALRHRSQMIQEPRSLLRTE
jgi:hypothetical protein